MTGVKKMTPPKDKPKFTFGHAAKSFGHAAKFAGNVLDSTLWKAMGYDSFGTFYFDPIKDKQQFAASQLGKFSPEEQYQVYKQFLKSVTFDINLKSSMGGFDTYDKAIKTDREAFLKKTTLDKAGQNGIIGNFKNDDSLNKLKEKFNKLKNEAETLESSADYNPEGFCDLLTDELNKLKTETETALDAQLEANKASILQLKDADSKFKDDMFKALIESHTKASEALLKAINEDIKKVHTDKQNAIQRITYLARLYEHGSDDIKRHIKKLAEEAAPVVVISGGKPTKPDASAMLKNIDLNKISQWQTKSGLVIQTTGYDETENENGNQIKNANKFSITLPRRTPGFGLTADPLRGLTSFLTTGNFLYYHSMEDHVKADLMEIADRIKAGGFKGITMNVRHSDTNHAKFLAKKAYEACIESGFDPKNITIKINGVKQSLDYVAKTKDEEAKSGLYENRQGLIKKGEALSDEREKLFKTEYKNMRNELETLRKSAPASTPTESAYEELASVSELKTGKS